MVENEHFASGDMRWMEPEKTGDMIALKGAEAHQEEKKESASSDAPQTISN
jgi:hypothetical protein